MILSQSGISNIEHGTRNFEVFENRNLEIRFFLKKGREQPHVESLSAIVFGITRNTGSSKET